MRKFIAYIEKIVKILKIMAKVIMTCVTFVKRIYGVIMAKVFMAKVTAILGLTQIYNYL